MKIESDKFEMYYLLEGCFRGSHLRATTIYRFVDEWYDLFSQIERRQMYNNVLTNIYYEEFKPLERLYGADKTFMARYNPDNQYKVTMIDGSVVNAFLKDGRYYIKSNRYCAEEFITKVEKL